MEQQKVLWVIFSVTLVSLAIVVTAYYWFLPETNKGNLAPALQQGTVKPYDPALYVRIPADGVMEDTSALPGIEEPAESGETLPVETPAEAAATATPEDTEQTSARVSDGSLSSVTIKIKDAAETKEKAVVTVKEPAVKSPVPAPAAKPAPVSYAKPAPAKSAVTQYWIQVGSYASRSAAEDIRSNLDKKGFAGIVAPVDVNGKSFYRVRSGPYQAKDEADKFLSWIVQIKGLENSYISEVSTQKAVN